MSDEVIEKLTDAQQAELSVKFEQCLSIGRATGETDRSVKGDIISLYEENDEKAPNFIWVKQPYEAMIIANYLAIHEEHGDKALTKQIEDAVTSEEYVSAELVAKLKEKVVENVKENPAFPFTFLSGSISIWWIGQAEFARDILNVDFGESLNKKLEIYGEICRKCGLFLVFPNVCIVSDRHSEIHFDDDDELHNEDGPALAFSREGCDIYAINGVVVPKIAIESPESITLEMVKAEQNAEVRRILIDRMGIGRYLEESGAEVLHTDEVPATHKDDKNMIPRALLRDYEGRKFLVGTDGSTDRVYYMQVPENCNTCEEAGSALAGFDEKNIVSAG